MASGCRALPSSPAASPAPAPPTPAAPGSPGRTPRPEPPGSTYIRLKSRPATASSRRPPSSRPPAPGVAHPRTRPSRRHLLHVQPEVVGPRFGGTARESSLFKRPDEGAAHRRLDVLGPHLHRFVVGFRSRPSCYVTARPGASSRVGSGHVRPSIGRVCRGCCRPARPSIRMKVITTQYSCAGPRPEPFRPRTREVLASCWRRKCGVLDIGCGSAETLLDCSARFARGVGLDESREGCWARPPPPGEPSGATSSWWRQCGRTAAAR